MQTTINTVMDWTPIACWLISMACFALIGPRLRLLGPLSARCRRVSILGTFSFFLGLGLFMVRLMLDWFFRSHAI